MISVPWSDAVEGVWLASPCADVESWLETFNGCYDPSKMGRDGYIGAIEFETAEDAIIFKLKVGA
jgi:hypothetical protein